MRFLNALWLILLSFASVTVLAQWPPDAAAIFADGIIWELVERDRQGTSPAYTNSTRTIRVYVAEEDDWQSFDFPEDIPSVYSLTMQSDGMIRIIARPDNDFWGMSDIRNFHERHFKPQNVILLDPATGTYTLAPTVCEGLVPQDPPGTDGSWVVTFRDNAYMDPMLCQTQTGEMREILPQGLGREASTGHSVSPRAFQAPDGETIVLIGYPPGQFKSDVYAYHLKGDTWTYLGQDMYDGVSPSVCDWVSNTQGLLCSSFHVSGRSTNTRYSKFDTTQPHSLELIFSAWGPETLIRTASPPQFIAFSSDDYSTELSGGGMLGEHSPCTITYYSAQWHIQRVVGYECVPLYQDDATSVLYYQRDNHVYFLSVDERESAESKLWQIDLSSPEASPKLLYTAEIEGILSSSRDGRYVVLLTHKNGVVNFPLWDVPTLCCIPPGRVFTIIDTQTAEVIHQSDAASIFTQSQVWWLDDRTMLTGSGARQITFYDDHIDIVIRQATPRTRPSEQEGYEYAHEYEYPRPVFSPDRRYQLRPDHTILDFRTFEDVSLFRSEALENYSVSSRWVEESNQLLVSIYSSENNEIVYYRVTLPD